MRQTIPTSRELWKTAWWQKIRICNYNGNSELDQKKVKLCTVAVMAGKEVGARTFKTFWICG
jgi:hypothetical protein